MVDDYLIDQNGRENKTNGLVSFGSSFFTAMQLTFTVS